MPTKQTQSAQPVNTAFLTLHQRLELEDYDWVLPGAICMPFLTEQERLELEDRQDQLAAYEDACLEYEYACTAFIAEHERLELEDRLATSAARIAEFNKSINLRDIIRQRRLAADSAKVNISKLSLLLRPVVCD